MGGAPPLRSAPGQKGSEASGGSESESESDATRLHPSLPPPPEEAKKEEKKKKKKFVAPAERRSEKGV